MFAAELKPYFVKLSQDNLLGRCLKGLTQNQNESINHILWNRCPKTRFVGVLKIRLAVAETVSCFNKGTGSDLSLYHKYGAIASSNTFNASKLLDSERIKNAAKKITTKYRLARRVKRSKALSKAKCTSYKSGSFEISVNPENMSTENKSFRSSKVVQVTFCDDRNIKVINFVPMTD